ncbi:MAG TPA: heavy-metal-associated domain-containing protein [Euzebyales bacterium]|nr:heavy-metal-associated domain-containing protein [Euzebyales bacterium]
MAMSTTYTVAGMTCGHCVAAVKEEIGRLDGVTEVDVDLVEGGESTVRVISRSPLDGARVRDAVDEAGYELTGAAG